ncbi:MAG: bifunctional SulP family inorganic anion transporter/carbonic anhydrase [Verrucomicrobiaceae bacterium]|nr:bifunctional SulP family inorganic anion transporter/carbonic anhydrase [Verrucomicrobiaceae bacterium]
MTASTTPLQRTPSLQHAPQDFLSGLVVFLVALPLCLGIALASGAPLFSGIVSGVIGGILVGALSGSSTSVSGPAAGLTAVVAAQISTLGSFEAFLTVVVLAGIIQIFLGIFRAGFIAAFFPNSVIKGLLAAIGVILILKQIPHVVGHDPDPEGEMSFIQADHENTFTEIGRTLFDIHPGAALVGAISLLILILWERTRLKKLLIPAPLVVVVLGTAIASFLNRFGAPWGIEATHLVQVPTVGEGASWSSLITLPDYSQLASPAVYLAAITIAIVASLETLLNIEAVDKLDPHRRTTPANRELLAQGIGNVVAGAIGGLPMTSVVIRGSVNVQSGGRTKLATIIHGLLLAGCVLLIPTWLNKIPLAALAAILLLTGYKLASPKLVRQMWAEGRNQFFPFIITVVAIVVTDLLVGILIGLGVAILFILHSNFRRPLRRVVEKHVGGEVLRIELANQVSFLNRAVLERTLNDVPRGGHVLLDASRTDYIDPDVLDLIHDFRENAATAHGVELSLKGFREEYRIADKILFQDFTSREIQDALTPDIVIEALREGNKRFLSGEQLTRDLRRQVDLTSLSQHPMAVILSCIDSRTPAEMVFDVGLGDVFSVRIAGNVAKEKVFASMEFACAVAGAKLVLVLGHTSCGAVSAAVDLFEGTQTPEAATGCDHLSALVEYIQQSVDSRMRLTALAAGVDAKKAYVNDVARENVIRTVRVIRQNSKALHRLESEGRIKIIGGMYDLSSGAAELFEVK